MLMCYDKVIRKENEDNVWYSYPSIIPETEGQYLVYRNNGDSIWYDDAYWVKDRSIFNEELPPSPGWIREDVVQDEYCGVNTSVKAWRPYPGLGEIKGV